MNGRSIPREPKDTSHECDFQSNTCAMVGDIPQGYTRMGIGG
jgi:hypothetical protein